MSWCLYCLDCKPTDGECPTCGGFLNFIPDETRRVAHRPHERNKRCFVFRPLRRFISGRRPMDAA